MTDKEKLEAIRAEIERRIAKRRSEIEKYCGSLIDKEKLQEDLELLSFIDSLEEPKKCMYTNEHYTDEDRKVLCEDCKEKCEYNKKEEPVSEDLEEAAYKAYPYNGDYRGQGDSNSKFREVYIKGYLQAEKDLELTWEDMRELYIIFAEVDVEIELCKADNITAETIGYYQEVLKRFKAQKGE